MSKNRSNSVIFGGTNAMLWRAALLEVGGFVEDVVTEDFATGIELEKKVYRGIAIDTILASEQTITHVVIIFWLFVNLYYMVMSLYVSWGRNMTEELFAQKELPHKLGRVWVDEVFTALLRHLTES